ncbi:hypothetical protein [Dactylosporangium sp. CA-139066]|uniref:hypothetical protein n=1 Tax=Dactylosporangium sp. CA-139066 TaxID=3239930 RepID=UPI003D8EEEEC
MSGRRNRLASRTRAVEVYAFAASAFVLAAVSTVSDVLSDNLRWATALTGIGLLALHAARAQGAGPPTETVIGDRSRFRDHPLTGRLADAREIWIFGLTAGNVLNAETCRILRDGVLTRPDGRVRVAVLDPLAHNAVALADDRMRAGVEFPFVGLTASLNRSTMTLYNITHWPLPGEFAYRYFAHDTGFSLVVVNPQQRDGEVIVEFHGFKNRSTTTRMHLRFTATTDPHWYAYWLDQFEAIWQQSRCP